MRSSFVEASVGGCVVALALAVVVEIGVGAGGMSGRRWKRRGESARGEGEEGKSILEDEDGMIDEVQDKGKARLSGLYVLYDVFICFTYRTL